MASFVVGGCREVQCVGSMCGVEHDGRQAYDLTGQKCQRVWHGQSGRWRRLVPESLKSVVHGHEGRYLQLKRYLLSAKCAAGVPRYLA